MAISFADVVSGACAGRINPVPAEYRLCDRG